MNKTTFTNRYRRQVHGKGFTLVEILVASLILSIILVLLLGVINGAVFLSSNTVAQIDSVRIGRDSLNLIGRDLTEMPLPYPRNNINSLQFVVNPTEAADYKNHDTMFWQAPLLRESADNTKGNMVVVGYFVLRDLQANPQNSRFQLRRVYTSPTDTTDYKLYSATSTAWIPTLANYAPSTAAGDNDAAQKGWVADGVLGMWIQCLDSGGYALPVSASAPTFDSRAPIFGTPNAMSNSYPANYPYTRLPAFVQVTLVCVGPLEISRVLTLPTTAQSGTAADFLAALRAGNAGVKSAISVSRMFRLPCSD